MRPWEVSPSAHAQTQPRSFRSLSLTHTRSLSFLLSSHDLTDMLRWRILLVVSANCAASAERPTFQAQRNAMPAKATASPGFYTTRRAAGSVILVRSPMLFTRRARRVPRDRIASRAIAPLRRAPNSLQWSQQQTRRAHAGLVPPVRRRAVVVSSDSTQSSGGKAWQRAMTTTSTFSTSQHKCTLVSTTSVVS